MPDTTPGYAFPYATGTDPLADGATSMQALAAALDTHLHDSCIAVLRQLGPQGYANTIPEAVAWDDTDLSAEFSLDGAGEVITYTGPARFVAWRWGCEWAGDPGPSYGVFRADGSVSHGSDDWVIREMIAAPEWFVNNDAGVVWMASGSEWRLDLKQQSGGSLQSTAYMTLKGL